MVSRTAHKEAMTIKSRRLLEFGKERGESRGNSSFPIVLKIGVPVQLINCVALTTPCYDVTGEGKAAGTLAKVREEYESRTSYLD
jgi:hypothetical protein